MDLSIGKFKFLKNFVLFFSVGHVILGYRILILTNVREYNEYQEGSDMFILLAGGLLVIIVAVIIAVVSSVASAVAAETDTTD